MWRSVFQCIHISIAIVLVAIGINRDSIGEIIVDDFDVGFEIRDPYQDDPPINNEIRQTGIGPYGGSRNSRVVNLYADPNRTIVSMDSNVTRPSSLTLSVSDPVEPGVSWDYAGYLITYAWGVQMDITEGGRNNAVLIDIRSITGPSHPAGVTVKIEEGPPVYARSTEFIPSSGPYTIAIPFSAFTVRGVGTVPHQGLDLVRGIQFGFTTSGDLNFPVFDDGDWKMEIDRIRIGYAVPEPFQALWWFASIVACDLRRRRLTTHVT